MTEEQTDTHKKVYELPMTNDDFVLLDNKLDHEEPTELSDLRQGVTKYISTSTLKRKEVEPEFKISRISNKNMWKIQLEKNFTLGQLGEETEELPSPKAIKLEKEISEPSIPKWSGVTYHPKISGSRAMRPIRRAKDKRVISDGYIFGPDDRQVYYPSGYPWRCIGKIFVWTNPSNPYPELSGAGALVGRNVVLTVSHVIPWGSNPWMMQFIPAYYDGTSLLGSSVSSYVQTYQGYRSHCQGNDMAVLKLYTPLGETLGWFGSKTYHDSWEDGNYWTKCGYPSAIASGQRPSRITWFPIIDDDNDCGGVELEYHADASGGDSGGPVFGWWGGLPYVIGTHSGSEEEYNFFLGMVKNNVAAGGNILPNLINWAHSNW